MKNLLAGVLAIAVLVPAAEVSQKELERGRTELVEMTAAKIDASAAANKKHTWVKVAPYNFSQKYAFQRELQKKGYDFDVPLFGSTWIGW